jgi:hypothetical protein
MGLGVVLVDTLLICAKYWAAVCIEVCGTENRTPIGFGPVCLAQHLTHISFWIGSS